MFRFSRRFWCSWKHRRSRIDTFIGETTVSRHSLNFPYSSVSVLQKRTMRWISAFSSPINIQAVVLLTLAFILSVQRVAAASVTLSASLRRKIPFKYQGDTYHTWLSIHGGVGLTLNRPLYVHLPLLSASSLRSTYGDYLGFVGSWYTGVQASLTTTSSRSKTSHPPVR